ncbi:zona pellucida sperm-binding protein 3-like [Pimephales promelas]|uniref:zona pellucida sperm-binding protein 3-like n=1 Tax=Pimephales promelas TaxID=90988 RepID=UPI001955C725|nr:zona pellucida sperm-binding protein 3-like [Pimephales promelas]
MHLGEAPFCTFSMRLSKYPHLLSLYLTTCLLTELYLHFDYKRHKRGVHVPTVNSPSIYITCILKATIASAPSDAQHKSCSFANRWFAADGNDQVCGCCDSTCGPDGEFFLPQPLEAFNGKARACLVL